MAKDRKERERKFLLASEAWRSQVSRRFDIVQGYLCVREDLEVRVRTKNSAGSITVKGRLVGDERPEYEADTKPGEAEAMLANECLWTLIKKVRHEVEHDGLKWEIDVFLAENEGLILAEVELPDGMTDLPGLPEWAGTEVTKNKRYYNQNLSRRPYTTWSERS